MIKAIFIFLLFLFVLILNIRHLNNVKNTIDSTSSIQYQILKKRKYKSSSSRYEVNILYNKEIYKVNVDRYTYYKIDDENIYPDLFYDKSQNKIYSERDVSLGKTLNGLIIFVFLILIAPIVKHRIEKKV